MEKKLTMLITDDMEVNRVSLGEIFRDTYNVLEAENGEVALTVMREKKVDLLLLDLFMPVKDGFTVIREMKQDEHLKEIPIIVKTAIDEKNEIKVLDLGADEFIFSPFNPEIMKKRVQNIAEKYVLEKEKAKERLEEVFRGLKVPIGGILGITQLSDHYGSASPETATALEKVKTEAEYLLSMVNDAMENATPADRENWKALNTDNCRTEENTQTVSSPRKFDAIHALVFDEDEITRNYQTSILARLGIRYSTTDCAKDALEMLKRAHDREDDYNICFINWQSAEGEVGKLISEIRGKYSPDAQIIAVGPFKGMDTTEGAVKTSGVDYIMPRPVLQSKMYDLMADICKASDRKNET